MLVRPMVGRWELPRIEAIASRESRRLALLPVPGLSGSLQQDLGRDALEVEISGSLYGDEARDAFLKELRTAFLAGDPVDFVADIVNESELEQVLIVGFALEETAAIADEFRYRLLLREYTEPPEPPATGLADDFGLDVDADLGLDVDLGLDLLDIAGLLGDVPEIGDLLAPIQPAAQGLKDALAGAGDLLSPLASIFD
ncbi:conserved hypothetical protein [Rubrivivax sp. A210]|uniref:hypothetical protein n=1 Tax=Rubrivivax sp. A210 TaxID=2772301 RepID=UPI00191B3587|nr:hypothetical protein [Rubrivivax sp. A210]CAD5366056.1 conserved hypothetical protein [Rubrivivax sp. A210]